jgi:hypothetical protein
MSNFVKLAAEAGDQYLATLAEGQEQFLKFTKTFAAWAPSTAAATPADDFLPTPREIVEANFAFTTKLLKQQKAFSEKLFAATTAS